MELVVDLVFLCDSVEDLLVGVLHAAVGIHQAVDHINRHLGISGQLLDNDILLTAYRLTINTNVDTCYLSLENVLELLDHIAQGLHCLVDIVDHAFANA